MAPTPPPADAMTTASVSSHDERTRRNVACVNCRNSKVRCRTSSAAGQPCQRCARTGLECVVDKTHKRVTKRSKLEQLEQEVRAIQQAVIPQQPLPPQPAVRPPQAIEPAMGLRPVEPRYVDPANPPLLGEPPSSLHVSIAPLPVRARTGPTESRVVAERLVPGDDVDYYFAMQHFHPFVPVLRKRDPDECFQAQPMLFWAVVYVSCRRYARDPALLNVLVDHINRELWAMLSLPALGLEEIHALLFIASWPLPTTRMASDPASMLANVAVNAALNLGLHTGRGSNPQFCLGSRNAMILTDEEASATWAACFAVMQRTSTITGHPPPSFHLADNRCAKMLEPSYWADLLTWYLFQKFLNRFHSAMLAQISSHSTISDGTLRMWELELEALKPSIMRYTTDLSRIASLAAMLEIQLYHFHGQSMTSPNDTSLQLNTLKTFNTARTVVLCAADLQARRHFLSHGTNSVFRLVSDAACVVCYILHSAWAPRDLAPDDAHLLAQQACRAVQLCSVSGADLPFRIHVFLDLFWKHRASFSLFDSLPPAWVDRGGSAVIFGCLERFKACLLAIQNGSDGIQSALKLISPKASTGEAAAANGATVDPFQDVDWTVLADDLGRIGSDGVLFGLL